MEYPHLKTSPISELLLDIQTSVSPETTLSTLSQLSSQIMSRYPISRELKFVNMQPANSDSTIRTQNRFDTPIGYRYIKESETHGQAFQARFDGFTYSRLYPAESWSSFKAEASDLWTLYSHQTNPVQVNRIGLRTINNIKIPFPFSNLKEYILTMPDIAPGIHTQLSRFFMQLVLPQPEGETALITSTLLPPADANESEVSILFDIDVNIETSFLPESDSLWITVEKLHNIRNSIFFNSLTDKAMELFNA